MTYHWGCNKNNTIGVNSGAEIHIVVRQEITCNSELLITGVVTRITRQVSLVEQKFILLW